MNIAQNSILPINESWFRQLPANIVLKDVNSTYIDSTDYYAKLVGYKNADHIIGIDDYDIRCKAIEVAGDFINEDKKVLQTKKTLPILYVLSYVDNQIKSMISNKSILYDKNNEIIGTICQCVDVNYTTILKLCNQLQLTDHQFQKNDSVSQLCYMLNTEYDNVKLSKRESECLFYLLRGKSYRAIAEILKLSPRTIESHIDHIKNKMNCANKAEVIEKAITLGYTNVIPPGVFNQNLAFILNE